MKPLIIANWKMNPVSLAEAKQIFNSVAKGIKGIKNATVVICPPFVYLSVLKASTFTGGQDCFWENPPTGGGAFTGEISPAMLKDLGCEYVVIGHSERRIYQKETDEMLNKKIKAAIGAKLKPIFCIGETKEQKKAGKTLQVLKKQLQKGLKGIENCKLKIENLVIAYEPVWAIGTGTPCDIPTAKAVNLFIRKMVKNIPIIYGASVNAQNAPDFIKKAKFQGFIVGGVSLNPEEFIKLVKNVSRG